MYPFSFTELDDIQFYFAFFSVRTYFGLFSSFLTYSAYLAFPSHSQRYTASLGLNYSASLCRDQLSQLNPILLSRYSAFLTLS